MKTTAIDDSFDMKSAARTTGVSLGVAAALWFLGRGNLSTPPVDSWTELQRWLGDRSTAEASIAALRASAVVAAAYLAVVSGLTIVAKLASFDRLDRLARGLVPRSIRPLIGVAVGASVVTAAASLSVPRDAAPTRVATVTLEAPTDATATMYLVSDSVPATSSLAATAASTTAVTTSTIVPPTTTAATMPVFVPQPPTTPAATPATETPHTWTIARGEHLWRVASETLADSWKRAPSDTEIVSYWRDLIEVNRSRLVDASNPDFVLAGQTFVLPDVPSAPPSTKAGK